jgi:hypothetical protein
MEKEKMKTFPIHFQYKTSASNNEQHGNQWKPCATTGLYGKLIILCRSKFSTGMLFSTVQNQIWNGN